MLYLGGARSRESPVGVARVGRRSTEKSRSFFMIGIVRYGDGGKVSMICRGLVECGVLQSVRDELLAAKGM
jgi:hypothetical protein